MISISLLLMDNFYFIYFTIISSLFHSFHFHVSHYILLCSTPVLIILIFFIPSFICSHFSYFIVFIILLSLSSSTDLISFLFHSFYFYVLIITFYCFSFCLHFSCFYFVSVFHLYFISFY